MCSNETSLLASDQFHLITLHCLTAVKVPLHILAAFVIITKTPNKMNSVKDSMLVLHLMSAFLDIYISFICVPVLTLPMSAGYALGISLWLGIPTPVQVYIGCSLLSAVSVSILGSFEDRHYILKNGISPKFRWKRILYLSSLYILSFIYMTPTYLVMPNQIEGKYEVMQKVPCLPREVLDRPGFFVLAFDNTVCLFSFTLEASFLTAQLIYFIISISRLLSKHSLKSKVTHKLQKRFMISLALHTLIPTILIVFPVIYLAVSISQNIYNQGATNVTIILISMHGMLSTITMLISHKSYRVATLTIFKLSLRSSTEKNESRIWKIVAGGETIAA